MRPFDKPALSVEQQLELLKQRGLQVANDDRAMRFLEVVTLFRQPLYASLSGTRAGSHLQVG